MIATNQSSVPSETAARALDFTFQPPEIQTIEVFLVDGDVSFLETTQSFLENLGYAVQAFSDPVDALEKLQVEPPHILVTDLDMPEMSGLDLARRAHVTGPDIGIILVSGVGDETTVEASLPWGVMDRLTKPTDLNALAHAVQRGFLKRAADDHHRAMVEWMHDELERNTNAIREVTLNTLASLVNALDARSPHFRGHSQSVAMQAAAIAEAMDLGLTEVEAIRTAGLLHDVGMIAVPDALVQKPESLTRTEFETIRSHCEKGAEILEPMRHLESSILYVYEHHEHWDGSGYPEGKKRDEISLGGQIVGISEAWTAILESRAYRAGRSREEGMRILERHRGVWFSEVITDALQTADVGVT